MKHDGERWKINEMDEMLSHETKTGDSMKKKAKKERKEKRSRVNRKLLGWISFTLIKALVVEVV